MWILAGFVTINVTEALKAHQTPTILFGRVAPGIRQAIVKTNRIYEQILLLSLCCRDDFTDRERG
jgi:hypothetical protein